ncbi:hypothetical protein ACEXTD_003045 [Salmonella enterica]
MMIKVTINNDALRTRIQALRNTSANTLTSTAESDADALEELLRLRTAMKIRRVRVVQSGSCDCEESCECMPGLYVTVDSRVGHGHAVWTYRDDGKSGLAYWCEFMGLTPFWADDQMHAAEMLREKLAWLGDHIEVAPW